MNEVYDFLHHKGLFPGRDCRIEFLAGDGSNRKFVRVIAPGQEPLVVVVPEKGKEGALAEAMSTYQIGCHLFKCGVPVPKIIAFDEEAGIVAFTDLGDLHLQKEVRSLGDILPYYREALEILLHLQIRGRDAFNPSWCWDTPVYDEKLMLDRESGYFLREFWHGFLGQKAHPEGLSEEFGRLARKAGAQDKSFLLHRDFQSRNLMVKNNALYVIDFQGARFGPLGYDLASLLIDPYVALKRDTQEELLDWYLTRLAQRISLPVKEFMSGYHHLALQRNLQILGAFAFLSQKRQKNIFLQYIPPAAANLHALLGESDLRDFPLLRGMSDEILILLPLSPDTSGAAGQCQPRCGG